MTLRLHFTAKILRRIYAHPGNPLLYTPLRIQKHKGLYLTRTGIHTDSLRDTPANYMYMETDRVTGMRAVAMHNAVYTCMLAGMQRGSQGDENERTCRQTR